MGRAGRWVDLNAGGGSKYTIHQLIVHLKSSYSEKDFNRVEQILIEREERIKAEAAKKKGGVRTKVADVVEVDEAKKRVDTVEKEKLALEERLRIVEKENEELKGLNLRAVEVCNKLYNELREVEESERDRTVKLELKIRVEEELRKKVEEELKYVAEKFKEQEKLLMGVLEELRARQLREISDGRYMVPNDSKQMEVRQQLDMADVATGSCSKQWAGDISAFETVSNKKESGQLLSQEENILSHASIHKGKIPHLSSKSSIIDSKFRTSAQHKEIVECQQSMA